MSHAVAGPGFDNPRRCFDLNKVSLAFISDRHYALPTAVAITSLISNKHPDTCYDVFIITADIPESVLRKFHDLQGRHVDIHIVKTSLKPFDGLKRGEYVTHAAYLKFYLPDLLPDCDKILYIDSDVMIQKDLRDVFETDIEDYYAGVVEDVPLIHNALCIAHYFNSGVLLLNLRLMREHDASTALFNICRSAKNLVYIDQDPLNIFFKRKVRLLPVIYNFEYNVFFHEKNKFTLDTINHCFGTHYGSLEDIKKDAVIIHFAAHYKPWLYFDTACVREWDEYFQKSPFKHHPLKRKSAMFIKFIFTHNFLTLLYFFIQYWRRNGLKFAVHYLRSSLSGNQTDP